MTDAQPPSLAIDRRALALLDELLDADATTRQTRLMALHSTDQILWLRVQRLLRASEDDAVSRRLGAPLAEAAGSVAGLPGRRAGDTLGDWRLLRELGHGGMSVVWLAERADGHLRRQVALKLPLWLHPVGVLAERFARERDVLAALQHPHIAQLFDAGIAADGQPFLVLEAVSGVPITAYAADQALTTRQRVALFLQVLQAVAHAHAHMVVHRDLKPANILVDARGQVKLLDFGIAKLLDDGPGANELTRDAGAVLTPRYAAPEQVLGQAIGAATDVYAAGVVLYELLCGRSPYDADTTSVAQLMHAVTEQAPRAPGLSRDLDTILLKAMHKAPDDRYASADRFAEDLRRWLDDQPILARRVPAWQRLALLVRRHRVASSVLAFGTAAVLAAGATAWQQAQEAAVQHQRAGAVGEFVYAMFDDAEPLQGRAEVSGLDILDAAVARARLQWAADPRLRGELLGELGRVYFRLQQPERSQAVLEEALALLQAQAPADDPALNRSRAVLARTLIGRDAQRAPALAQQALAACTRPGPGCAGARIHAHYALAAIDSWTGRHADALAHARAMVRDSEASGASDPELALALETVATLARELSLYPEALAAVERAQRLVRDRPIRAMNRNRLDLLQAALHNDLGQHAEAATLLRALTTGAGADAEHASQWRALATAEAGLGRPQAALAAAEAALAVLPASAPGALRALTRQAWGRAASRAGRPADALRALDEAVSGLQAAGFAADSDVLRRAQRQRAEALLRAGRVDAALTALQALQDAPKVADDIIESAALHDALGCARLLGGDAAAARPEFAAARSTYDGPLPVGHPLRLRSRVLLAMSGDGATGEAMAALAATWTADSPWRQAPPADCAGLL